MSNYMPLGRTRPGFENMTQEAPEPSGYRGGGGDRRDFRDDGYRPDFHRPNPANANPFAVRRQDEEDEERGRKPKSRWGPSDFRLAPPAPIPPGLTDDELKELALHMRIDEITRRLRNNDFVPPDHERYVSLYFLI